LLNISTKKKKNNFPLDEIKLICTKPRTVPEITPDVFLNPRTDKDCHIIREQIENIKSDVVRIKGVEVFPEVVSLVCRQCIE